MILDHKDVWVVWNQSVEERIDLNYFSGETCDDPDDKKTKPVALGVHSEMYPRSNWHPDFFDTEKDSCTDRMSYLGKVKLLNILYATKELKYEK